MTDWPGMRNDSAALPGGIFFAGYLFVGYLFCMRRRAATEMPDEGRFCHKVYGADNCTARRGNKNAHDRTARKSAIPQRL